MPLLFIGAGVVLLLTGTMGNISQLWQLVKGDFSGPNNFTYWLVAMIVLGGLGYIQTFHNLSRLFMVLVLLVMLVKNRGFFTQLQNFINSSSTPATAQPSTSGATSGPTSGAAGG